MNKTKDDMKLYKFYVNGFLFYLAVMWFIRGINCIQEGVNAKGRIIQIAFLVICIAYAIYCIIVRIALVKERGDGLNFLLGFFVFPFVFQALEILAYYRSYYDGAYGSLGSKGLVEYCVNLCMTQGDYFYLIVQAVLYIYSYIYFYKNKDIFKFY